MRCILSALISFLLFGCNSGDQSLFTLVDPKDSGIDFINWNTETEKSNILTYEYFYNGGGVALGDINNDGLIDIYFSSTIYENRLYLNEGNFKFKDITAQSGTSCKVGWKTGVSMVDINNDGFLDIYVCRSASPDAERRRNLLLVNNGNNTFTEKAKEYNLDDDSFSTQAAFFDFDHDNDLDVILLNHSTLEFSNAFNVTAKHGTTRFPFVGNKFLENVDGKFIDISDSVGVYGPASNYGLGVSLSDINNDGWIDIYVSCDYTGRDRLLMNKEGQRFEDATNQLSHISKFTMGTDIADFNGDGNMDLFTVDMLPEDNYRQKQLFGSDKIDVLNSMVDNGLHYQYMRNMLHMNNGDGSFSEIGQLAGVSNTDWSWGALFGDYNNDGIQDLFVSNGFKRDLTDNDFGKYKAFEQITNAQREGKKISNVEVIEKFNENKIPNYIFHGGKDKSFTNATLEWGFSKPSLTNGIAYGDLDNDGDLDLVTNNINDPAGIYENHTDEIAGSNFLRIRLKSRGSNGNALGAKVTLHSDGKLWVRENLPVRGFQSSVDPTLHFGLGNVSQLDSISIVWPDGTNQVQKVNGVNQVLTIEQDSLTRKNSEPTGYTLFNQAGTIPFKHQENEFVDFRVQALLPRSYSTEGPAMASGDVNNDGLIDLFVGGAKGQSGQIFLKQRNGSFQNKASIAFDADMEIESIDALFFDADGDNDLDLYVVTGGYEFAENDPMLSDKFYLNNGQGEFTSQTLPEIFSSGSCVAASDVDGDGDLDLFVGGRVVPGRYPESPESVLLINDGKGNFKSSQSIPQSLRFAGMVTDALWTDLNGDKKADLIVVGEWMPMKVFINEKGMLTDKSDEFISARSEGFWSCLIEADFDHDGDIDFVAGNYGLNSQLRASQNNPVTLVYDDFDQNGSIDPILNHDIMGKSFPYPTRDELLEQLPSFKKRFTDYKSYAVAQIQDVLTLDELSNAKKLSVAILETCFVKNDGGKFTFIPMPKEFQFSPVFSLALMDVNGDGYRDLISGGNLSQTRARTGKLTGNSGFVFESDGKGNFAFIPPTKSGISISGDVRELIVIGNEVIVGVNNDAVKVYKKSSTGLQVVARQ
jgi:enediyne biosynthesis protein E4